MSSFISRVANTIFSSRDLSPERFVENISWDSKISVIQHAREPKRSPPSSNVKTIESSTDSRTHPSSTSIEKKSVATSGQSPTDIGTGKSVESGAALSSDGGLSRNEDEVSEKYRLIDVPCKWICAEEHDLWEWYEKVTVDFTNPATEGKDHNVDPALDCCVRFVYGVGDAPAYAPAYAPFYECHLELPTKVEGVMTTTMTRHVGSPPKQFFRDEEEHLDLGYASDMCKTAMLELMEWITRGEQARRKGSDSPPTVWQYLPEVVLVDVKAGLSRVFREVSPRVNVGRK